MRRTLFALLASAALVAGATGIAIADQEKDDSNREKVREAMKHSEFRQKGDKWILHNEDIAVWFASGKHKARPDIRVVWNGTDDEKAGYRVKLLRICEVDDSLKCRGDLPRFNLAKADDWNVVTEKTNDSLTLTMVRTESQAIVTLVWHLNTTSKSVKYDIQIDNWRWANASHKLLLDQVVLGRNIENATGDSVNVADSGYIRWATTASTNLGTLNVTPIVKPLHDDEDEDEDEKAEKNGGHLQLLFNGTGGYSTLDYDPEFGIAGDSSSSHATVPAPGILAGLLIAAAAAMVLGRKR